MNYLRKLLGLCVHEWEVSGSTSYTERLEKGEVLQYTCKHCKAVKYRKVSNPFSSNYDSWY